MDLLCFDPNLNFAYGLREWMNGRVTGLTILLEESQNDMDEWYGFEIFICISLTVFAWIPINGSLVSM